MKMSSKPSPFSLAGAGSVEGRRVGDCWYDGTIVLLLEFGRMRCFESGDSAAEMAFVLDGDGRLRWLSSSKSNAKTSR